MKYTKTNYMKWIQLAACLLCLTAATHLYAQENIDQSQRIKLLDALKEADAAVLGASALGWEAKPLTPPEA